jgi:hypothetical protein
MVLSKLAMYVQNLERLLELHSAHECGEHTLHALLSCTSVILGRFDEKKQSMEPGFPRKIAEDFPGVDSRVDAVFEAFGKRTLILLAMGPLTYSVV